MYDDSIIVKYEIRVTSDDAKRLCDIGAFNGVGFIIVPIRILKIKVGVVRVIGNLDVREMASRAIMLGRWIIIFYKDAFAIQVGIFWPFFSDEVQFSGDKGGWRDKS